MNSDVRLAINFWQHPKTIKTARKFGLETIRSIQCLWCFAALNRVDGSLSGMDIDDVEIAADWQGEAGKFVDSCIEMKWIDVDKKNVMSLHGWEDMQGWAIHAPDRKEKAKRAAEKRWSVNNGLSQTGIDATSIATGIATSITHSNAKKDLSNAPSPNPNPNPNPNPKDTPLPPQGGVCIETVSLLSLATMGGGEKKPKGKKQRKPKGADLPPYSEEFERIWFAYPNKVNKGDAYKAFLELWDAGVLPAPPELVERITNRKYAPDWQKVDKDGKTYVPHFTTWLHKRGWEDAACFSEDTPEEKAREEERSRKYDEIVKRGGGIDWKPGEDVLVFQERESRILDELKAAGVL